MIVIVFAISGLLFTFARHRLGSAEFCGACFSPDGGVLFLNVMGSTVDAGRSEGVTVAIRGPWEDGAL